jgi:hypothetical protein
MRLKVILIDMLCLFIMTVFSVHKPAYWKEVYCFLLFNIMDIVQWNEAVKNILDCYIDRFM